MTPREAFVNLRDEKSRRAVARQVVVDAARDVLVRVADHGFGWGAMQGQDVGAAIYLCAGNMSSNRLTKRRGGKWGGAPNLMEYSYPHHFVMITDETPWQGEDVRR